MTTLSFPSLEDVVAVNTPNILNAFSDQFRRSPDVRRTLLRHLALSCVGKRHNEALASIARRIGARLVAELSGVDVRRFTCRAGNARAVSLAGLQIAAKAAAAFALEVAGAVLMVVESVRTFEIDEDDERVGLTIEGEEAMFAFVSRMIEPEMTFGARRTGDATGKSVVIDASLAPGALIGVETGFRKRMVAASRTVGDRWELTVESIGDDGDSMRTTFSGDFWIVSRRAYDAAEMITRI